MEQEFNQLADIDSIDYVNDQDGLAGKDRDYPSWMKIPQPKEDNMTETKDLIKAEPRQVGAAISITEIKSRLNKIHEIQKDAMIKDTDFGTVPGTKKPTLYKAGAETLGVAFSLSPKIVFLGSQGDSEQFTLFIDLGNGHREYIIRTDVYHIESGNFIGSGVGSCSTMEVKYRYRWTNTWLNPPGPYWKDRNVSLLQSEALKNGFQGLAYDARKSAKGKWYIFVRVEHEDLAEQYNTVLKMAAKRSYVAAMLTCTGASRIFTQDVEDMPHLNGADKAADGYNKTSFRESGESYIDDESPEGSDKKKRAPESDSKATKKKPAKSAAKDEISQDAPGQPENNGNKAPAAETENKITAKDLKSLSQLFFALPAPDQNKILADLGLVALTSQMTQVQEAQVRAAVLRMGGVVDESEAAPADAAPDEVDPRKGDPRNADDDLPF